MKIKVRIYYGVAREGFLRQAQDKFRGKPTVPRFEQQILRQAQNDKAGDVPCPLVILFLFS